MTENFLGQQIISNSDLDRTDQKFVSGFRGFACVLLRLFDSDFDFFMDAMFKVQPRLELILDQLINYIIMRADLFIERVNTCRKN